MPRINYVRYTVKKDGSNEENYRSEEGTTVAEMIREDLCSNPDKFAVYCNGDLLEDLDVALEDGDSIELQPKKHSSGIAA